MNYITWLYFLKEKKTKTLTFLYGLSLATNNDTSDTRESTTKINKRQNIVVYTTISNSIIIKNNCLDFNFFIKKEKYESGIIDIKNTILVSTEVDRKIPCSILNVPLYTTTYYTKDIHEYIENYSIEELNLILEKLSTLSSQDFTGNYLKRIGCYEVGKPQKWLENRNSIFELGQKSDIINNKREYFFEKKEGYLEQSYLLHLIVYNRDNEILFDIIKQIPKEEKFISLLFATMDAGFEYWVFNDKNELIARDNRTFILFGSISINIFEAEYTLPKETFPKKSSLSKEDIKVKLSTRVSHNVGRNNLFDIQDKNRKLYRKVQDFNEKDNFEKYGKWFKKDDYKDIIKALNEITKEGEYKLTLIDPFISSTASLDYLYHFENTQISLQFISCWAKDTSPDNDTLHDTTIKYINELKETLDNIQDYKIPLKNTTWYNFKEKKFHDRFIYIENISKKEISIYTISNSFNNMLTNYENLSIIPLHGNVLINAREYIGSILSKCNETNKIYPIVGED